MILACPLSSIANVARTDQLRVQGKFSVEVIAPMVNNLPIAVI